MCYSIYVGWEAQPLDPSSKSSSIFCGSVCKFNALRGGQWSIRLRPTCRGRRDRPTDRQRDGRMDWRLAMSLTLIVSYHHTTSSSTLFFNNPQCALKHILLPPFLFQRRFCTTNDFVDCSRLNLLRYWEDILLRQYYHFRIVQNSCVDTDETLKS